MPVKVRAADRCLGVLCAMPEEAGLLGKLGREHSTRSGLQLRCIEAQELGLSHTRLLLAVSGIGKVLAARASALLLEAGARDGLLVVGTCGGLRSGLGPGSLVHCSTAVQADLAVRALRERLADARLRAAWQRVLPGIDGFFLTADRPVLSPWRRLRLARAFAGPCVADMETAAVALVASEAGVPWAAVRAVTDRAGFLGGFDFQRNYPQQAPRAAASVPALLAELEKFS